MNHVFLDLDGTLADPGVGITACFEYAAERLGLRLPGDVRRFVGPPLRDSFREIVGAADPSAIEEGIRLYRERFATTGIFENEVYHGIPEALDSLSNSGVELYVVTAKPRVFALRIVDHFRLTPYFRGVYGPTLDGHPATKTELLAEVMTTHAAAADRSCMVGDRSYDMTAARANGASALGVLWGYGTEQELVDAGASTVVASVPELAGTALRLLP